MRQVLTRVGPLARLAQADDARFAHFEAHVAPGLMGEEGGGGGYGLAPPPQGTLVYIPSYFDYVRVRNFLDAKEVEFVTCCEYTEEKDVARARCVGGEGGGALGFVCFSSATLLRAYHPSPLSPLRRSRFLTGASPILLMTERFYFYFRTRIKGARRVLFYAPPTVPHFYPEVVNLLLGGRGGGRPAGDAASVSMLFTRGDALALERIVGTRRLAKLLDEGSARSVFTL